MWYVTTLKLVIDESDNTIAELMTDGCNMGVKCLSRYLNQYAAADEMSKDITKRLIKREEQLAVDMRQFLQVKNRVQYIKGVVCTAPFSF